MDSSTILAANRDVRILAPDSEPIGQLTLGPRTDDQPKRTLKIVHDVSRQPLEDKWLFGFWRGPGAHRTTIEPSTRQFGLPA